MTLKGWTLPLSATGRSSIVAPPPWHYSGEIIAFDFTAPVEAVAALLPRGLEPAPDGAASVVFADWCSARRRVRTQARGPRAVHLGR